MFWLSPEFLQEQQQWYEKLNDTGFQDIETKRQALKEYASSCYKQAPKVVRDNKLEYFLLLSQGFEAEKNFDSEIDIIVMTMFKDGYQNKDIVKALIAKGNKRHRKTVMFIRRKYELRWQIRNWKPDQLKSKVIPHQKKQALK